MLAIIVFIVILGVLIFVHELGHFVVARRNGIRAEEFGFGFPPRIVGFQFVYGKKKEKFSELESVEVEKVDLKEGKKEIIQETVTRTIGESSKTIPTRRWRLIWGSKDGDSEDERKDKEDIQKHHHEKGTIYSLNWIPLGGFVKIKGENGESRDPDSFITKSAWTRTKVLAAGVVMNFILAWFLISSGLFIGAPEPVDSSEKIYPDSKIQISDIVANSPAQMAGLKIGDEILKKQSASSGQVVSLKNVKDVQDYINSKKGESLDLEIKRGAEFLDVKAMPRVESPAGQGPLGISLSETVVVKYPFYKAFWKGLVETGNIVVMIVVSLFGILKNIFSGHGAGADITGPVGIAVLTKSVAGMGFVYILQFAALLSINLGIINILPIPALDGGRIFFVVIEKLRGYPVSQKTEQAFHTIGFALLILLMVLVTFKDIARIIH